MAKHKFTFTNLTTDQAIAMADGLALNGQYNVAGQIYEQLLAQADPAQRARLLVRRGLMVHAKPRTAATFRALQALEANVDSVFIGDGLATWYKTLPFFEDARFQALADKHAGLLPISNWHWNLNTALWAVRRTREVEGDLVELGVFKGHTTLFCAEYVEFQTWPKTWHLYDTFEGVPDDQLDPGWKAANKSAYAGTFSFEEVTARFAHIPNIRVIKGRVPEILHADSPGKISFLHVDLNNSTAEVQALDLLFDRLSPGGVIVFDDYGWATSRAQYDAENAWFARRGLQILPLPTGQGLFVKS